MASVMRDRRVAHAALPGRTDRIHTMLHPLLLEPRSVLVMQDDARYQWKHSIPVRNTDTYDGAKIVRARRLSLTFRNVIPKAKRPWTSALA